MKITHINSALKPIHTLFELVECVPISRISAKVLPRKMFHTQQILVEETFCNLFSTPTKNTLILALDEMSNHLPLLFLDKKGFENTTLSYVGFHQSLSPTISFDNCYGLKSYISLSLFKQNIEEVWIVAEHFYHSQEIYNLIESVNKAGYFPVFKMFAIADWQKEVPTSSLIHGKLDTFNLTGKVSALPSQNQYFLGISPNSYIPQSFHLSAPKNNYGKFLFVLDTHDTHAAIIAIKQYLIEHNIDENQASLVSLNNIDWGKGIHLENGRILYADLKSFDHIVTVGNTQLTI